MQPWAFWYNKFERTQIMPMSSGEKPPTDVEVPSDEGIEVLLNQARVDEDIIKKVKNLLGDPGNMFLENDKKWIAKQLERIINESSSAKRLVLKVQFFRDVQSRSNISPR